MPNATLNAVTFTGDVYSDYTTVRRAPKHITPKPRKIGREIVAASGATSIVLRGSAPHQKVDYELEWENVAELTRAAVRAIFDLATTFSATLPAGTATYQCGLEDYQEKESACLPSGTRFYNVTLTIRQP